MDVFETQRRIPEVQKTVHPAVVLMSVLNPNAALAVGYEPEDEQ